MTDNFALLNEARRPWLDGDALKAKFLGLSSEAHPDRFHNASDSEKMEANQRYAALNAAYACLSEPKDRLAHLLELELGARVKDVQRIPPGTMDLFIEVGEMCRQADDFLAKRAKVDSPLLKVKMFEQGMELGDRLGALQGGVNLKRDGLMVELRELDKAWDVKDGTNLPLARVEEISRILSYVARWTGQIQERVVQLSGM